MHFSLAPKHHWSDLLQQWDTLTCTLQKGHFLWIRFPPSADCYHMPHPPAVGHLVFADSAHSSFLSHPSVKSRAQTQPKLSLLQKTCFLFCFVFLENNVWPHIQYLLLLAQDLRTCTREWEASPSTYIFLHSHQAQKLHWTLSSHWYYSVANSCLTLCDYMYGNRTGFPVFHHFV